MERAKLILVTGAALLFVTGCGADVCDPGADESCACEGGASGSRTCGADGAAWSDCVCDPGGDEGAGVGPVQLPAGGEGEGEGEGEGSRPPHGGGTGGAEGEGEEGNGEEGEGEGEGADARRICEPELCDGEDNDCDGETDEGWQVGAPCRGRGTCGQGLWECAGPDSVICSTMPGGTGDRSVRERCDGEDNDCDGDTDEDAAPDGWACIPPTLGSGFWMGSPPEEPGRGEMEGRHRVVLRHPILMKQTEVTQAEWQVLMGDNPATFADCGPSCPVETVSWAEALAYCNALSRRDGLDECYRLEDGRAEWLGVLGCYGYRLPTEAEWEHAARAGSLHPFHTGPISDVECGDPALDRAGWYCGNAEGRPHDVGGKEPNLLGLYDMAGNVWEWAWDVLGPYGGDAVDPTGPIDGAFSVARGGSWRDPAADCRAAARHGAPPPDRFDFVGLRPVRTAD